MPCRIIMLPCNKSPTKTDKLWKEMHYLMKNFGMDFTSAYNMVVKAEYGEDALKVEQIEQISNLVMEITEPNHAL